MADSDRMVPSVKPPPRFPLSGDQLFEPVGFQSALNRQASTSASFIGSNEGEAAKAAAVLSSEDGGDNAADAASEVTTAQQVQSLRELAPSKDAHSRAPADKDSIANESVELTSGSASQRQSPSSAVAAPPAAKAAIQNPATGTNGPNTLFNKQIPSYELPRAPRRFLPHADNLKQHFFDGGVISLQDAEKLILWATALFDQEPNVLKLASPITVCGDIHGQYYDLMTLLKMGGSPGTDKQYLFLGDYVDRGSFSTEVTLLLFAYKVRFPNRVWLIRGNHECRHLTHYFNFREECLHKYDERIYDLFMAAFDRLPLAAVIDSAFLGVHGGLSPDIKLLDELVLLDRVGEPQQRGAMCDLLWADPMDEEEERLCPEALFLHNEMRSCSYVFSHAAVCDFLEENKLYSLIRAHEAQEEGYRMFRKVKETGMPSVICVFSAPNYCDYDNKAAIMQLDGKNIHFRQYYSAEHPYVLPNFMNAFGWSLPFLVEKVSNAMNTIMVYTELKLQEEAEQAATNQGHHNGMMAGGKKVKQRFTTEDWRELQFCLRSRRIRRRSDTIRKKAFAVARFLVMLKHIRAGNFVSRKAEMGTALPLFLAFGSARRIASSNSDRSGGKNKASPKTRPASNPPSGPGTPKAGSSPSHEGTPGRRTATKHADPNDDDN